METHELHRGRLIDHLQLVVEDLAASKRFYGAVLDALEIPLGGEGDDYFWADELFVSSKESRAAQGALTGRMHFAFQGKSRAAVERCYKAALPCLRRTCSIASRSGSASSRNENGWSVETERSCGMGSLLRASLRHPLSDDLRQP